MINVKLAAGLRSNQIEPQSLVQIEIGDGLTVQQMLERLGIPIAAAGIIVVNGNLVKLEFELRKGDKVEIYPIFGGG